MITVPINIVSLIVLICSYLWLVISIGEKLIDFDFLTFKVSYERKCPHKSSLEDKGK